MNNRLTEQLGRLLNRVRTLGITCYQIGDTAKGKIIDLFAYWADAIIRGTGGGNAGHTISVDGKEHVLHLVPCGILYDSAGKINIIGTGVALDPGIVCQELEALRNAGLTYEHLLISHGAKLVLPQHLVIDRAGESNSDGKIGTTGRGIGPVYGDHYTRIGLTANDLLNPDCFVRKLRRNLRDKVRLLQTMDPEVIKAIMQHPHLANGRYWNSKSIFDVDAIAECYLAYGATIGGMISDTDRLIQDMVGSRNILLEGSQGNMLSIDHGTYPYVTSSDCSIRGLAKGAGLSETDVDLSLGTVKFPYMTRVGEGPFPTELGGEESAKWCGSKGVNKQSELEKFGALGINQSSEFLQGVAMRMAGNEYGATTKRSRRTGCLDLCMLRLSVRLSGPDTVLTKPDVLDGCEQIRICDAYQYNGKDYRVGQQLIRTGQILHTAILDNEILSHCRPIYTDFPGWLKPIRDIRSSADLPPELRRIWEFVEEKTGMRARIISVGPDREQTIVVED